ncbi:MAG: hypothetical protein ACPGU7_06800 [Gammaproteobacteria bacterium]
MSLLHSIVFVSLMLSAAALFVAMAVAILTNVRTGARFRQELADQLGELRLKAMLDALGLDPRIYLHQQNVVDIHRHMKQCDTCTSEQCEPHVRSGSVDVNAIGFCANQDELKVILERHAEAGLAPAKAA